MLHKQSGLSLVGFLLVAGFVGIVLVLGMKTIPAVIEYYIILKNVNAIVKNGEIKGGTVADYRTAFSKRSVMDEMSSVTAADLDIIKDSNGIEISFAYDRKVHMFGPVSILFEFEGSAIGPN
jgi:hypothetical protein